MPTVAVVGGSLGGLTAALLLHDLGCEVTVYERTPVTLEARGAGIAVLEETLRYPLERQAVPPSSICSTTSWIRFLEPDGNVRHERPHNYRFSSWNTIYRTLLSGLEPRRYALGREMTSFEGDDRVTVRFVDGGSFEVDLLVCADGIGSASRSALLPGVTPRYAGYVGWRGTIPEAELSRRSYDALHDALTYQLLAGSHLLVYPIPGPDGAVEPGRRLMNMVWYRNVHEDALPAFLTDRTGQRRSVSLPPGTARDDAIEQMRGYAREHLAAPLAEIVTGIAEPFVQAVFDIDVPRMAVGRACLLGDAAFAVRPHAAAGTAKAAEDGWVLAQELEKADGDVTVALAGWESQQLALGRDLLMRTRQIGNRSQFGGGLLPGDKNLIFGLHGPGR